MLSSVSAIVQAEATNQPSAQNLDVKSEQRFESTETAARLNSGLNQPIDYLNTAEPRYALEFPSVLVIRPE